MTKRDPLLNMSHNKINIPTLFNTHEVLQNSPSESSPLKLRIDFVAKVNSPRDKTREQIQNRVCGNLNYEIELNSTKFGK